jgi:hypothetical protein
MDLTSCFGKIKTSFNAKYNVTISWSSFMTLACVDADTFIAILDQASTFTLTPLLVATTPTIEKLKFTN